MIKSRSIERSTLKSKLQGALIRPSLTDRQQFERYLAGLLQSAEEKLGFLAEAAFNREKYLASIDHRLVVRAGVKNGAETYEIAAAPGCEGVAAKLSFDFGGDPQGRDRLDEAIRFGMPATIEVQNFRLQGSPVFQEIGIGGGNKGQITVKAHGAFRGVACLYAGRAHSITATPLYLPVSLNRGSDGFSVTNDGLDRILAISLRANASGGRANLGISWDNLFGRPLAEWFESVALNDWAEQVLDKGEVRAEFSFNGKRFTVPLREVTSDGGEFLRSCQLVARLHAVAKFLCSEVVLEKEDELTDSEAKYLDLAYRLLRGEQVKVTMKPFDFEPNNESGELIDRAATDQILQEMRVTSTLYVLAAGKKIGEVPIIVRIPKATIESSGSAVRGYQVVPCTTEACMASYFDGDPAEELLHALER